MKCGVVSSHQKKTYFPTSYNLNVRASRFFCLAPALLHSSSSSLDNLDAQRSRAPRRGLIFIFCQLSLLAQTLNVPCVLSPQSVWEFLKFAHWVSKLLFGCILLLDGSFFFFFFFSRTVNGFAVE